MSTSDDALTAAGWYPGRDAGEPAMTAALMASAVAPSTAGSDGWSFFPAAREALREFHGLTFRPAAAGAEVAATGCVVDPRAARHALRPLRALGDAIGEDVFPFGRTDADSLVGVTESGRLVCVDHGGRWLLGDSAEDGLRALTRGRAPRRIAPRRWTWAAPTVCRDPLDSAVRTALVGVYVLHHRGLFGARSLRLTVTALRGIGDDVLERAVPLPGGSLDEIAAPLVARLRQLLDTERVRFSGCALTLVVGAPEGTAAPYSSVSCAVRVGHSAAAPAAVELSLSAGAGTVLGRAWEAVHECTRDLARYSGTDTERFPPSL
ncbi:SUKH-3 domain-containing protein [Streptomyces somaliensis]|uniref:SUKH-3 domain-containing protein n=1 Tax=Streptomyces somaliensis TaxID=78355 RepID=UPI0020CF1875|nr:SUKH-3 domain-containing protein [Streptomyces somaliensis]MCP9945580.1 SUKH-3 domain-containing protein [Streptomyces somaliensis]MCP9961237.1 SUKH-3 domain-containing protein [Streptomyces somaliensis]MCP9974036.1 SUKH-3 domain-containing protein [Streptomyces somaliensis]